MIRLFLVLCVLPLLNACLYVELTGHVSGARVSVVPLRGGPAVVNNLRTTGVEEMIEERGADAWAGYSGLLKLLSVGFVRVPTAELLDNELYLVTAVGGRDMDWDGNGNIDRVGTEVIGSLHAIMTGAQLRQPTVRMNLLTDAIYRLVADEIDELSDSELLLELDRLAASAVADVDQNGVHNYRDVLSWSQLRREFPYPGDPSFLLRSEVAIGWGLDPDLVTLNAENLVHQADWSAAVPGKEYSDRLVACTTPVLVRDLCTFDELPLLGQISSFPRNAEIMSRVVVTHDWMRHRFEQVLRRVPADIRSLFRSVSAIVIGDDIRPSYFDSVTAAIYLDAGTLWVTEKERKTVSDEPDYRAAFASQVQFADRWRYVKNNEDAFGELDETGNSTIDDVALLMASLLFHELAHAADFIPPARLADLDGSQTTLDLDFTRRSQILGATYPLRAVELFGLAGVLFAGFPATAEEAAYTAAEVGALFEPDAANDLYAYNTPQEDLAMLFEEAMMSIHYGIRRDTAFTSVPDDDDDDVACSDFRVGWGVRGRIAAPQLSARVGYVLAELLPERDYSAELASLPAPIAMDAGRDWCQNLVLGDEAAVSALSTFGEQRAPPVSLGDRRRIH